MRFAALTIVLFLSCSLRAQESPHWIWSGDGNPDRILLKHVLEIQEPIKSAVVVATGDNNFELVIGGTKVLSSRSWEQPESASLTQHMTQGKNVLAITAGNEGGIAAFMMDLRVTTESGKVLRVMTDPSWKYTERAPRDWKTTTEIGSDWKPVRSLGVVGGQNLPWTGQVNAQTIDDLFNAGDGSTYLPSVAENVTALDGFRVEKVFHVPRSMGSWVSLTTDDRGSLIASDQGGSGLYRITPGSGDQPTTVARIPVQLSGAQGLLWAFDSLYAMVNGGPASGLHRLTDTDGDGELDHDEHVMKIDGGGEHGPHAIVLSPDKKSLYVCAGNHTRLPAEIADSRIPQNWNEDLLLPRRWDANGHAAGILAPGGWICEVDSTGKVWTVHSIGFRNQYDIAFNADGELFSYDADMEWDLGSPWYRPTRVVHATSGSEFGWRSGTGKWPTYYEDSLPPVVDIGPGSPVGIVFGYGAKFPTKYQRALFILDWTYSTIYAVHLTPDGATYVGEKEDFVTGQPLQVTDATIGSDGALYFAAGGRGTQSSLYRVTYVGDEPTRAVNASDAKDLEQRRLRQKLEAEHGQANANDVAAIDEIVQSLGHSDRFIRYAARIALETRPVDTWRNRIGPLRSDWAKVTGAIAVARQGAPSDLDSVLSLLAGIRPSGDDPQLELARLRAYQLALTRLGPPSEAQRTKALATLDPMYPVKSSNESLQRSWVDPANAELVQLLVYLNAPKVIDRTLALMSELGPEPTPDWGYLVERHKSYGGTVGALLANMTPARAIHYAFVLRNANEGWSMDQRRQYFQFFIDASKHPGGNSYAGFLSQTRDDALATCTPEEKVLLDELASTSLVAEPPHVEPPQGPGREWSTAEALKLVGELQKRNFARGRNLFHATQCAKCHRLNGEGGAIGPDLSTASKKYPLPDLLDAVIEPSKAISDQYGSHQILTSEGAVHVGRLVKIGDKLSIYTADPDRPPVVIEEADVDEISESKVSQMPTGLINGLNEEELKDLLAYLISGGNRRDRVYR